MLCSANQLIMCLQRVKQLYQDANLGQKFKVVKFIELNHRLENDVPMIKSDVTTVTDGWNIQYRDKKLVCINVKHKCKGRVGCSFN